MLKDSTHVDPEVSQHCLSHLHLLTPLWVAAINDMQNEIRLDDLFERAAERRHQMMRELADEAHGVDEDRRGQTSEETLPKLRIEVTKLRRNFELSSSSAFGRTQPNSIRRR